MIRRALVPMCLLLVGCLESHDVATTVQADDCATCHLGNYNATSMPVHKSADATMASCSTDCAQCHVTATWTNSLGGCNHPDSNDRFPLTASKSQHRDIKCIDCHSQAIADAIGATSAKGADTDCTGCHPKGDIAGSHTTFKYATTGQPFAYSDTDHRFCLDCHPGGYIVGHSPTNPFPLPHHRARCANCHDYASGLGHSGLPGTAAAKADVKCSMQCHTGDHHRGDDLDGNPATKGCFDCHRNGHGD